MSIEPNETERLLRLTTSQRDEALLVLRQVEDKLIAMTKERDRVRESAERQRMEMRLALERIDDDGTARATVVVACRTAECPCFCGAHVSDQARAARGSKGE